MAKSYGGANPMKGGGSSMGGGSSKSKTNNGASTGLTMSNERRADVTRAPSSKNPYPKGLC